MHNAATVNRQDIAEIYDRLAEMSTEAAMNWGGPGDVPWVVTHLVAHEKWHGRAEEVRATITLGNLIGNRVA